MVGHKEGHLDFGLSITPHPDKPGVFNVNYRYPKNLITKEEARKYVEFAADQLLSAFRERV